jgi:hypothetical protein
VWTTNPELRVGTTAKGTELDNATGRAPVTTGETDRATVIARTLDERLGQAPGEPTRMVAFDVKAGRSHPPPRRPDRLRRRFGRAGECGGVASSVVMWTLRSNVRCRGPRTV